ncbi:enoyl-CoA hydratase-related protein [Paracoccus pacificus]|uniref:Enoyl-CoA hydratase-related protein n=1 Tax=Paracoccus pacificus TaxID=1463598 RepID=A0ABW4R5P9_9RHOB
MTVELAIRDGGVARVTIDRPERMNAVDAATEARLEEIWRQIEADADLRVVVLTGAGERAFSAGADMKSGSGRSGMDYWATLNPNGFGGIGMRRSLKIPVIARVNGLALGGGFEMVLGCDIVIAAEDARFGLPEAKVGRLPLDGGMIRLPRQIAPRIAAGLMMTGRMLPAPEAARLGLVNAVVPRADLDAEVDRWVADILACAPLSVRAIKEIITETADMPLTAAHGARLPELMRAMNSEDSDEGVRAFNEKRPPVWRGR